MSERLKPFDVTEHKRAEGPYTTWKIKNGSGRKSNLHTYSPDAEGKFRVISRADFETLHLLKAVSGGDHGTSEPEGETIERLRVTVDGSPSEKDVNLKNEVEKDIKSGDEAAIKATATRVVEEFNREIRDNGYTERSLYLDALHTQLLGALVDMHDSTSGTIDSESVIDGSTSSTSLPPEPSSTIEGDTGTAEIPDPVLLELLEQADPEVFKDFDFKLDEYIEARSEYVMAHASERGTDLGGVLQDFSKPGGRFERVRSRVGKALNTRGHKRREALEKYKELDIKARKLALAEYGRKYGVLDDEEKREKRMLLDAINTGQLEYDISIIRREIDRKRNPAARTAALIGGLGAAALLGALTAVADGEGKGGRDHPLWWGAAFVGGAVAGYAAERASRASFVEDYKRPAVKARADEAYESIIEYYTKNPAESMEGKSVSADRMEYLTYEMQDKNLSRGKRSALLMTLGGAAVAGVTHWAVESDLDASGVKSWFGGVYGDNSPETTPSATVSPPAVATPPVTSTPPATATPPTPPTAAPVPSFNFDITLPDISVDIDVDIPTPPEPPEPAPVAPEPVIVHETVGQAVYVKPGYGVSYVIADYAAANRIELLPGQAEFIAEQLEPLGPGGILAGQKLEVVNGDFWIPHAGPDNFTPEAQHIIDTHLDTNGDQILNEHDMTEAAQNAEVHGFKITVDPKVEGFSHVVQEYAAANGISIDGQRALEVFLYVNNEIGAESILEGAGVYPMENGLPGISEPGTYTMTPEAQNIIDEQLGISHGE